MTLASLIEANAVSHNGTVSGTIGTVNVGGKNYSVSYVDNGSSKSIFIEGQGKMEGTQAAFDLFLSRMTKVDATFTPAAR